MNPAVSLGDPLQQREREREREGGAADSQITADSLDTGRDSRPSPWIYASVVRSIAIDWQARFRRYREI